MKKKSVLLTNHNIVNFAGSEIDTLTMAQYFLRHEYDVTIFTLKYGMPIIDNIDSKIKLINYENINQLKSHYDLIWAHHFPLLDYLLFSLKISADYIAYTSLSSYENWESFPFYYKELNHLLILSKEALASAHSEGYDISNFHIFPNYSFEKYFKKKVKKPQKLKRICIVSNHVPKELSDASYLLRDHGIQVDIYGKEHTYKKVDDELLKKYDLIISIGKTINYGLSLGIPCYCYDRFGGDGYLTSKNIKNSFEYNFSGRYSHIKMSSQELYDDIIKNFPKVLKDTENLRYWAQNNFCYEKMMAETLSNIYASKKFNLDYLLKKYPTEERRSALIIQELNSKNNKINHLEKEITNTQNLCKFYFDFGKGFSEKDSQILKYTQISKHEYYVELKLPSGLQGLRYDYTDKSLIKLNSIEINETRINLKFLTNNIKLGDYYVSLNNDPSIILPITDQILKITISMEPIFLEDILTNKDLQNIYLDRIRTSTLISNLIKRIRKGKR